MIFDSFIETWKGKYLDFDGAYGGQCFDVYRQYCQDVLNVPQSPATGTLGASAIWDTYLKDYFDRIENTPEGIPLNGDIVIWGTKIGKYGHVAIFVDGDASKFNSFDQNFPIDSKCHIQNHTYTGVLGWLRIKPNAVKPDWIRSYLLEKGIDISNEGDARGRLNEVFTQANKYIEAEEAKKKVQDKLTEAEGEIASLEMEAKHLKEDLQIIGNENIDLKKAVADREATIYRLQQETSVVSQPAAPPFILKRILQQLLTTLKGG